MKNKHIFNFTFIFCLFYLVTAYPDTIKISSEKLNVNRVNNISVFTGKVYAEDDKIKLWSDKLSIFYDKYEKSVSEIVAENNVKIVVNEVTAYGAFSKYKVEYEELLLEGDVIVIEKDNKIRGDQLILDLANSTSIMTAKTNSRVTAQINKLNDEE
tara:strand:+ start:932 stop:1399 length:468 start_codon:yes stop_codon:yes gene_type:complete